MSRLFHHDHPGLPDGWRDILAARSAHWAVLSDDERTRLGVVADELVRTKRWEAARGFELTDEVRTLVAGHAALLALGLEGSPFDGVGTIIVRAAAMRSAGPMAGPARGVVVDVTGDIDGEAHSADGPVMLVWSSARREAANPRLGRDVVLHEFAHKLDMLDGTIDGTPPFDDDAIHRRWVEVCTAAYAAVRSGERVHPLRPYAGTNPGEFFAVATEVFFTRPLAMQSTMADLYDVLAGFYRQDPAARLRSVLQTSPDGARSAGRFGLVVTPTRPPAPA